MDVHCWIGDRRRQVDPKWSKVRFGFLLHERVFFRGRHGNIDDVSAPFEIKSQRPRQGIVKRRTRQDHNLLLCAVGEFPRPSLPRMCPFPPVYQVDGCSSKCNHNGNGCAILGYPSCSLFKYTLRGWRRASEEGRATTGLSRRPQRVGYPACLIDCIANVRGNRIGMFLYVVRDPTPILRHVLRDRGELEVNGGQQLLSDFGRTQSLPGRGTVGRHSSC